MTLRQNISCNNCGNDLTYTTNSIDYRLSLKDEKIPCHDGFVTDMMIYPSLKDGSKHFCGLGCLKIWINK